jgi:hypothetical protein
MKEEPWELRFRTGYTDGDALRKSAARLADNEQFIVALALRGFGAGAIAVAIGSSEVAIQKRMSRFGLTRRRGKPSSPHPEANRA